MKIRGKIKCPYCGSLNNYPWSTINDHNIHEDSFFEECLNKSKEYTRLDKSKDNIIIGCYCHDCETTFSALLTLDIEIDKVYTAPNKYQLQMLNLVTAESARQKEEEESNEN